MYSLQTLEAAHRRETQTCENSTTPRLSRELLMQIYSRDDVLTGC